MRKIKTSLRQYAAQHNLEHLTDEFVSDGDLTPDTIGFDSLKEVKWICSYGHTETESPHKRVRRGYCSVCGPERKGSVAQVYPDILKYWNDPRDPYLACENAGRVSGFMLPFLSLSHSLSIFG